jgi:hypothetical protein
MSNVHGFGERNDRERGSPQAPQAPLLSSQLGNESDPRKETFFSFLKNFCCPLSTVKSFIFYISMIDLAMYIVTLAYGGIERSDGNSFLAPTSGSLDFFGWLVKILKKN